jgi:hypothetical protein
MEPHDRNKIATIHKYSSTQIISLHTYTLMGFFICVLVSKLVLVLEKLHLSKGEEGTSLPIDEVKL